MILPIITLSGISLGSTCSPILQPTDIYSIAKQAGFPPDVAVQMTAIALRESSGCANAHNPGVNGSEDSYGLWQINVLGNPGILAQLGLTSPTQLYDPATNAAAAYLIWGGNPNNLNTAWYINRPGYEQAYEANLPIAQAAAQAVDGTAASTSLVDDSSTAIQNAELSIQDAFGVDLSGSISLAGFEIPTIGLVLGGLLLLVAIPLLASRR